VKHSFCYQKVCLSVCLSITLVGNAQIVQDIKIHSTPYDTGMFVVSWRQILWFCI